MASYQLEVFQIMIKQKLLFYPRLDKIISK